MSESSELFERFISGQIADFIAQALRGFQFKRCERLACGRFFATADAKQRFCPGKDGRPSKCNDAERQKRVRKKEKPEPQNATTADPRAIEAYIDDVTATMTGCENHD